MSSSAKGRLVLILGTSSGAGKSFVATALCRYLSLKGAKVAPFKAQNMSLNAVAVRDGEMAWAQFVQALACEEEPTVRFNPILLKPVGNSKSELVVLGESRGFVHSATFDEYRKTARPVAYRVLEELLSEYDIVVAEGAGSPVEVNIKRHDFVNIAIATTFNAPALLVADIDRGGVFAQIVGTMELLEPEEKRHIKGFVINKFRGHLEILEPGLRFLEERTGVPTLAVLPHVEGTLPPEDSLDIRNKKGSPVIAVVRYPRVSNFSDLIPFFVEDVGIRWCTHPGELDDAKAVILPGSRRVLSDLRWLKAQGLDEAIKRKAKSGVPVVGICGGYHMLGEVLRDPVGTEGGGAEEGLGLLPVEVVYDTGKSVSPVEAEVATPIPWLRGRLSGYRIHSGRVIIKGNPLLKMGEVPEGCVNPPVVGTHLHNLFHNDRVRWEFVRYVGANPSGKDYKKELEATLNRLALLVEESEGLRKFADGLLLHRGN